MKKSSSRSSTQEAQQGMTYTPYTEYTYQKRMAFQSIREMQRLYQQIKFLQYYQVQLQQKRKFELLGEQKQAFSEAQRYLKEQYKQYLSQIRQQQQVSLSQLTSSVSSYERYWTQRASDFRRQKAENELNERRAVNYYVLEQKRTEQQKIQAKIDELHRETREFDQNYRSRADAYRVAKNAQSMRQKLQELEWLNREKETADEEIQKLIYQGVALGLFTYQSAGQ